MTRRRGTTLLLASALAGCGSVSSPNSPGEPVMVVTAKLSSTPPTDVDPSRLRATLVWTNGLGLDYLTTLDCDAATEEQVKECQRALMGQMEVSSSDVQVQMDFPLRVRLELYELPTPIRGQVQDNGGWRGIEKGIYHSVPEGELVLYEDGNGNGHLDLLPLGKAGPSPDRVIALSSGRAADGSAVRTTVVYKAGRILPIAAYMPLLPDVTVVDEAAGEVKFEGPNGVFALKQVAEAGQTLSAEALLSEHSLVSDTFPGDVPFTVTPIEEATIQLFEVEPERRSWLARACERLPQTLRRRNAAEKPPSGADVQCGSGALAFASHPDNYCGQVEILLAVDEKYQPATPSWWPCDADGLKEGTAYHQASERLDALPLYGERMEASQFFGNPSRVSLACEPGTFVHFGDIPMFRLPSVAPPAGSQVFCRSRDSLSYIPPRDDGCAYKFRYDLRATDEDLAVFPALSAATWDLRENPPSWWPCDDTGALRADSGYVAPRNEQVECTNEPFVQQPLAALEAGTRIRCDSADELTYLRDWVGACEQDGQQAALSGQLYDENGQPNGSWSNGRPTWWPCDSDGNFASDRYLPL